MKLKQIILAGILSLAILLAGCSASRPAAPDTAEAGTIANALAAYRDILKSSPAMTGEHDELNDASFDYEQNLAKFGSHYDMFALSDLNHDGVPELIAQSIVNFRWNIVSIYAYADGNAVLVKDAQNPDSNGTFEQNSSANGAYVTYLCDQLHIHSVWRGTNAAGDAEEENTVYMLDGTVLAQTECAISESENTIDFQEVLYPNTPEHVDEIVR